MKNLIWSTVILLLLFTCKDQSSKQAIETSGSTETNIPTATSSEFGIDPSLLKALTTKVEKQEYRNIYSALVAKKGQLFYEQYFKGAGQISGRDIGTIQFIDSTLHDVRINTDLKPNVS